MTKQSGQDEFEKAVHTFLSGIQTTGNNDDWLKVLYKGYVDRFIADNRNIWQTGSIFIALSLTPFVVLLNMHPLELWHILVLGTISCFLNYMWISIADRHRDFQERSYYMLTEIEKKVGLDLPLLQTGDVRRWRARLLGFVVFGWLLILILFHGNVLK